MGPFGDPLLQAFVGFGQRLFGFAERGDVGETHDEAAARHRVADQLDDPAVGEQALGGMRAALAHPVQATRDVNFGFAGAAQAALGIVANDVGDRPTDTDQAVRVVEQLQVATVPGHQFQRLVDHADALGDVLDGALQQGAVELQHLRGFVGDAHDVFQLHLPAFNGGFYHRAGRRGTQHTGQQAFGMGDPFPVSVLARVEAFALAIGKADEALTGAFFADEARRQLQQVVDLHCQHRACAGAGTDFLADEAACLPVLGNPGARQHRDPGEQREVASQRQHHALGQRGDRQVQWIAVQPGQPRERVQGQAEAEGGNRQDQGVEPQEGTCGEAGENAAAVGLFPVQRTEHGGGQLGHGSEGDLADGRQAGGRAQQAITDVGQQQNDHDADAAHRQHPLAEHFERALGVVATQQPGQQHVIGYHGRQRHAGHDHHAGGRRCATDKRQQGQRRMRLGQGQADDERVRQHRAGQHHLAGQGDRHDKQGGEGEVGREYPLGQAQILGIDVLDNGHVELPWQANDRHHRHTGLHHHRRPVDGFLPVLFKARRKHGLVEQVVETVVQAVGHEGADGEKREQLHQ
ncbi:hypothetical protein D9M71_126270 [compost metagenome]